MPWFEYRTDVRVPLLTYAGDFDFFREWHLERSQSATAARLQCSRPTANDSPGDISCVEADLLIPGRGEPVEDASVCFNTSIVYVGPTSEMPMLNVSNVVKVPVVMPGMWDVHTHYGGGGGDFPDFTAGHSPDIFIRFGRALEQLKQTLYAGMRLPSRFWSVLSASVDGA